MVIILINQLAMSDVQDIDKNIMEGLEQKADRDWWMATVLTEPIRFWVLVAFSSSTNVAASGVFHSQINFNQTLE